tara:strand:- start:368 stop:646 length:279 start_codon:yes stop_codon:yes gene_type:complete
MALEAVVVTPNFQTVSLVVAEMVVNITATMLGLAVAAVVASSMAQQEQAIKAVMGAVVAFPTPRLIPAAAEEVHQQLAATDRVAPEVAAETD